MQQILLPSAENVLSRDFNQVMIDIPFLMTWMMNIMRKEIVSERKVVLD